MEGRELTVAVMNGKALGVLEILPTEKFYNYKAKYSEGGADGAPCVLPPHFLDKFF